MSTRYSLTRRYLRAHVWLHRQCDRLTERQRKYLVFGLCALYFVCSVAMIAQLFLPQKEGQLPITRRDQTIVDSPIKRDSLHLSLFQETPT